MDTPPGRFLALRSFRKLQGPSCFKHSWRSRAGKQARGNRGAGSKRKHPTCTVVRTTWINSERDKKRSSYASQKDSGAGKDASSRTSTLPGKLPSHTRKRVGRGRITGWGDSPQWSPVGKPGPLVEKSRVNDRHLTLRVDPTEFISVGPSEDCKIRRL